MSDTNRAVQPQKIARGLKFWISVADGLYYLCSEAHYRTADLHLWHMQKAGFLMTRLNQ